MAIAWVAVWIVTEGLVFWLLRSKDLPYWATQLVILGTGALAYLVVAVVAARRAR